MIHVVKSIHQLNAEIEVHDKVGNQSAKENAEATKAIQLKALSLYEVIDVGSMKDFNVVEEMAKTYPDWKTKKGGKIRIKGGKIRIPPYIEAVKEKALKSNIEISE